MFWRLGSPRDVWCEVPPSCTLPDGWPSLAARERAISSIHAVVIHLKAHLLRHLVVMSIALGMLLVPATCANAAGPHSLFMSPMANHDTAMHHGDHHAASDDANSAMPGMSADEHAIHMAMGYTDTENETDSAVMAQRAAPAEESGVRLTDLPSTMAMAAISNPASIVELDALQFPPSSLPVTPRSTNAIAGRAILLELPPPR